MPTRGYTIRRPTNPILQVLYLLAGGVLLIAAVIASAFILAFVLGFAIIVGLIVYARVWWLSRKPGSGGPRAGQGEPSDSEAIEVEYKVIGERDERAD